MITFVLQLLWVGDVVEAEGVVEAEEEDGEEVVGDVDNGGRLL